METGLKLGSLLLHIESQMRDLTWSNKDPSYKAVSIFISVIISTLLMRRVGQDKERKKRRE